MSIWSKYLRGRTFFENYIYFLPSREIWILCRKLTYFKTFRVYEWKSDHILGLRCADADSFDRENESGETGDDHRRIISTSSCFMLNVHTFATVADDMFMFIPILKHQTPNRTKLDILFNLSPLLIFTHWQKMGYWRTHATWRKISNMILFLFRAQRKRNYYSRKFIFILFFFDMMKIFVFSCYSLLKNANVFRSSSLATKHFMIA